VRVPVLSEQMTLTHPRVSTVLSDLHKILLLLIIPAVIVRLNGVIACYNRGVKRLYLAVTAIGKPSGMKATATLTQSTMSVATLIQLGCDFRNHAALEEVS
jgi:hypothetical protein